MPLVFFLLSLFLVIQLDCCCLKWMKLLLDEGWITKQFTGGFHSPFPLQIILCDLVQPPMTSYMVQAVQFFSKLTGADKIIFNKRTLIFAIADLARHKLGLKTVIIKLQSQCKLKNCQCYFFHWIKCTFSFMYCVHAVAAVYMRYCVQCTCGS